MKETVDFVKELLMVLVLVVLKFVMGFLEMHDYEAFLIYSLAFEVKSEKINEMAFEMVIEMIIEMAFEMIIEMAFEIAFEMVIEMAFEIAFEMAFEMDSLAFVMGA